ncbi:MAG: DUF4038 domain-containing protein [Spirochaetales bacterium]|nr:DUF4038 domain-containing protein [Spirochaetales bacterium]
MKIAVSVGETGEISFKDLPGKASPWDVRWYCLLSGNHEEIRVPGFYNGEAQVCRFSLPAAGNWTFKAFMDSEKEAFAEGTIQCSEGEDLLKGGLRINPANRKRFTLGDDDSVFVMSYEANWLWALETSDPGSGRIDAFLKLIKSYGFNSVLMNAYAYDTTWAAGNTSPFDFGPPGIYPWAGSNEEPDFSQFNPEFWNRFDTVVEAFQKNGILLHLYFKVFNKMVNWPEQGSAQEKEYFRYVTARYQAYSCMIWDFSKESYYEQNEDRVTELMTLVKETDGYGRLRTVHDYPSYYRKEVAYDLLDFITVQQHHNFHGSVLLEHKDHDWPYLNAEFGYECGGGGVTDVTYGYGQTPQTLVERAWEVSMSGGYPAYYYTNTAWDIIHETEIPQGYQFFRILADFFKKHNFSRFRPFQDHCLWRSTFCMIKGSSPRPDELLMYVDEHILVPPALSFEDYEGTWLNIYSGEERKVEKKYVPVCVDREEYSIYKIPFTAPKAVLHLKRRK